MPEDKLLSDQSPAGFPQKSLIHSAFQQLLAARTLRLKFDSVGFIFAVVALQRYLAEQERVKAKFVDSYCYDVTVTDGIVQAKCHLASDLNHLVHKNIIRSGIDIQITQCSFVYNERRLGYGSVCIEKIEFSNICEDSHILGSIKDPDALPFWSKEGDGSALVIQNDVPLQTSRKYYLSLWNNEDPHGSLWIPHIPPTDVVLDVSKMILLCDLESAFGNSHRYRPLLVRIMHKSRLRFYGKAETKIYIPFQAYFEVADQSGSMSMVLWNALCPEWYQRLNVGTVLYLQNYSLKQSYQNRTRPFLADPQMKSFTSIEIGLNPRNPTAVIDVIPPKSVKPQWGLPDVPYHFISRSELDSCPNNSTCDVIGLVTFVGRCERIRSKGTAVPEKYWTYRWVHAIDGTSDFPFVLEIFASSQPEIFSGIYPMTYLVCTQMRVCRPAASTVVYLTSSSETQIFTTGYHKGQPYICSPTVKAFIQWTKTLKDSAMLKKTVIGGHYRFPPAPPIFTQDINDGSAEVPVVPACKLQEELESLRYREQKRLAVQGQITAVQYVLWPEEQASVVPESSAVVRSLPPSDLGTGTATGTSAGSGVLSTVTAPLPHKRRKKQRGKRELRRRYETRTTVRQERESGRNRTDRELHEERSDSEPDEEEQVDEAQASAHRLQHSADALLSTSTQVQEDQLVGDRPGALWESSTWTLLRGDLLEHLRFGGLDPESIPRKFSFDDREYLLQKCNLHPAKWTLDDFHPNQNLNRYAPAACKGYFRITILGINQQTAIDALFMPVLSSEDPRNVGLPRDPHNNTLFSCLSTGSVSPISHPMDGDQNILPDPGDIIQTAAELEGMHVVCLIDFCHLGGQTVEVFINKIYKMTDVALVEVPREQYRRDKS
ncbi:RPA-related protein RADX isoform X2 [Conger conger]|uniref:RPA-related protein RADX isoform X2 n=1 Tax=Conger conger TaxID=82655 RepID=UPI002A599F6D|nr:RPA-related protein RADX isoform X2 [Conger conger]